MNRCATAALALTMSVAPALPAFAQVARPFPQTALRGELQVLQPPEATIDGKPARLAPGARIRGENNMMMTTGVLAGQRVTVHYTLDTLGLVFDVWVLTAAERANKPWPATPEQAARWQFDPQAQTWSRR